jgi:hypothetical protein
VFNRAFSQYIDGGPHTFNIATNGGFTAVAVVKFTGNAGMYERIFDFGKGPNSDNILLSRDDGNTRLGFAIRNVASDCAVWTSTGILLQNTWLSVVAIYRHSTKSMQLTVGNAVFNLVCDTARIDRVVFNTYVGKSNWASSSYSQISIAGLYAVDELLSEAEIAKITSRMYSGEDTIQACETCPVNTLSLQGSTSVANCTLSCSPGYFESESVVSNVARMCGPTENAACPEK